MYPFTLINLYSIQILLLFQKSLRSVIYGPFHNKTALYHERTGKNLNELWARISFYVKFFSLTLFHSKCPKLHWLLAIMSAMELMKMLDFRQAIQSIECSLLFVSSLHMTYSRFSCSMAQSWIKCAQSVLYLLAFVKLCWSYQFLIGMWSLCLFLLSFCKVEIFDLFFSFS